MAWLKTVHNDLDAQKYIFLHNVKCPAQCLLSIVVERQQQRRRRWAAAASTNGDKWHQSSANCSVVEAVDVPIIGVLLEIGFSQLAAGWQAVSIIGILLCASVCYDTVDVFGCASFLFVSHVNSWTRNCQPSIWTSAQVAIYPKQIWRCPALQERV